MRIVCGCCEPAAPSTPRPVDNRPALSAIGYRIGTYASFRESMLRALAGEPALQPLTTRDSDDYGITVLELWATVADVLTFYQERYANEAFLRTARFSDSVARLARLIDYRPRPGVAARTSVVFTLDAGKRLTIATGQKVQSVPEQDQLPQTFETLEPVVADARLNRLRVFALPITANPHASGRTAAALDRLQGPALAAGLAPSDTVLLFNDGGTAAVEEKKVASVTVRDDRVIVGWSAPVRQTTWTAGTRAFRARRTFRLFGHNAPTTVMQPSQLTSPTRIVWSLATISDFSLGATTTLKLDGLHPNLTVGQKLLIDDTGAGGRKTLVTIQAVSQVDARFPATGSTIALAGTVTQLTVDPDQAGVNQVPTIGDLRRAVVHELDGPGLVFWSQAYPVALAGDTVYLPGVAVSDAQGAGVEVGRTIERNQFKPGVIVHLADVEKGRSVLVDDARGRPVLATVKSAPTIVPAGATPGQFCHLALALDVVGALLHDTASAVLLGNVAAASHGEAVRDEVLGSGDGSAKFIRQALKKKPLTHLPGTGPDGIVASLEVRVDGVRWREVPGLFGQPAGAPVYEVRTAEDGASVIQFGDGVTGAVPPTGRSNIVATYRVGAGLQGRVAANALTTLLAKPTGLAAATNPLPAEGGADPETLAMAREGAPRTVRTFGRAVSLRDFEDLVTASGEIAKASATWVWDGLDRGIHLTVAGQAGALLSEQARRDLGTTLDAARDPNHRLLIANHLKVFVELTAGVAVDPDHDRDRVLADVRAAVLAALSFDALRLGQPIHLSDLFRVMQDVPGVVFVDVDRLQFKKPAALTPSQFLLYLASRGAVFLPGGVPAPVQGHLRIFPARPDPAQPGHVLAAELAAVESATLDVTIETRGV